MKDSASAAIITIVIGIELVITTKPKLSRGETKKCSL